MTVTTRPPSPAPGTASAAPSAPPTSRNATERGLSLWDLLGIIAAAISMIVACLIATRRNPFFWYDELATWSLVSDPSSLHMVRAIAHGTENNPPLYELLLRPWVALLGSSELSMRLSTTLSFAAGFAFLWIRLRRVFSTRAVAIGLGAAIFGSQAILDELAQARFYGFFALASALALGIYLELARHEEVSRALLVANFVAHLLLMYSHLFGGFYSSAILVSLALTDWNRRKLRLSVYASVLLAWAFFLPWVPATLHQALMAQPRSWLARPGIADLFRLVSRQTLWLPLAIVMIAVLTGLERAFGAGAPPRQGAPARPAHDRERFAVLIAGVSLSAVVPAIYLFSKVSVPVFYPRYLIPSAWGWAMLLAYMAETMTVPLNRNAVRRNLTLTLAGAWGAGFLLLLVAAPANALRLPRVAAPGVAIAGQLGKLPVVVEDAFQFWPAYHYDRGASRYRFPLDSLVALDPASSSKAMVEYKLMQLNEREGYIEHAVVPGNDLLCSTPQFLVADSPDFTWFERRIAGNAAFRVSMVGTSYPDSTRLRLVTRVRPCEHGHSYASAP